MKRNLMVNKEGNYLHVSISGDYNKNEMKNTFNKLLDKCYEKKLNGLLLEFENVIGTPSNIDRYEIAVSVAQKTTTLVIEHGLLIVIALVGPGNLVDPDGLGETAAVNRGLQNKMFTELKDAKRWLSKKLK